MLSYPDSKRNKYLSVMTEDYKDLSLRAGNIIIKSDGKTINQVSCAKVFCIWIVWECTITTKIVDELLSYGISVHTWCTFETQICHR